MEQASSVEWGQWLWLSWQSDCFQIQRSSVRIQSSAKNYIEHFTVNCIEKTKIKRPGMAHLKNFSWMLLYWATSEFKYPKIYPYPWWIIIIENYIESIKIFAGVQYNNLSIRLYHGVWRWQNWLSNHKRFLKLMGHFSLFFFIFIFSIQLTENVQYKLWPMTGIEPQTSGIGSDRSISWATALSLTVFMWA